MEVAASGSDYADGGHFVNEFVFIWLCATASMEPTLSKGSYIVGLGLYTDLEKGDIIIFRHDRRLVVRRITAVGGEYVERSGEFLLVSEGSYYVLG